MRLKTKLALAINGMMLLVVVVLSTLYLSQLLSQRIEETYTNDSVVARQVLYATRHAIETGLLIGAEDAQNPARLRDAVAKALREDSSLTPLVASVLRSSPTVFEVAITDANGRILLDSDPTLQDRVYPIREDYGRVRAAGPLRQFEAVFGPPKVYEITLPLERNAQAFVNVRVAVRSTFLRGVFAPWMRSAVLFVGLALGISLAFSLFVSALALRPLESINKRLDALIQSESDAKEEDSAREGDAMALVSSKIERVGKRMRSVEEVFTALKENMDQILGSLEDGILLFTENGRAVTVSESSQRFLGLESSQVRGALLTEIFTADTVLGRCVRNAFALRQPVHQELRTESGRHIHVSVDMVHEHTGDLNRNPDALGALVTLHDSESVRQIEDDLKLSRRLAAVGRLTAGVGHEVKNPINAIVVHLELLRSKLHGIGSEPERHLDVIESEIHRLDRVVETLVNFSRPVDLSLKTVDLRETVTTVLMLSAEEMARRNIAVVREFTDEPVPLQIDDDLMRQALLNVILNAAQAMEDGGRITVKVMRDSAEGVVHIEDEGPGIAAEIRDKIFDLYFTTKKGGSGIGLSMTYRILQLHNGTVEVGPALDRGTIFTFRVPLAPPSEQLRPFQQPQTARVDSGRVRPIA
jgi:signal transduction histidine kinase